MFEEAMKTLRLSNSSISSVDIDTILKIASDSLMLSPNEKPIYFSQLDSVVINQLYVLLKNYNLYNHSMMQEHKLYLKDYTATTYVHPSCLWMQIALKRYGAEHKSFHLNFTSSSSIMNESHTGILIEMLSNSKNADVIDKCSDKPWTSEWMSDRKGAIHLGKYNL